MAGEIFATYIESKGIRRYFKDKRYQEPFQFDYDASDNTFYGFLTNDKYAEIQSYLNEGREVKCRVRCGLSYFYLRLSRHLWNGHSEDNMFSFDDYTYPGSNVGWFMNLRIWEDGTTRYSEGHYSVSED